MPYYLHGYLTPTPPFIFNHPSTPSVEKVPVGIAIVP